MDTEPARISVFCPRCGYGLEAALKTDTQTRQARFLCPNCASPITFRAPGSDRDDELRLKRKREPVPAEEFDEALRKHRAAEREFVRS